jgi:cytochrome P450/deferrochelatase/peroxidase EfeB
VDLKELQLKGLGTSLPRRDGQISHGLNLVLKLKDPLRMPLLLARIEQEKRKIDAGLGELNFVHFARFLPTHDNTALQVITEFDGPLAPYVLDFAIEIGGVFNTLLSYTQGTEHIVPIARHAAEFLAFVEEHNTVVVPPGTPELRFPDWPVYSAYPEQTVLDIIGPRDDLPIPKADRWATPVAREDVQANILRGYRAERVEHLVLRVLDAPKARAWLADKATPDYSNGGVKPELVLNIGLTYIGMEALGIREPWRTPFPEAFRQGARKRAADNFDTGHNAPDHWWLGGPGQEADIHVIVSVYHELGAEAGFAIKKALTDSLPAGGLELVAEHDAVRRDGVSWLGYADGIANPRIAVACPVPEEDPLDLQPASTAGEFVLGRDYKNIYGGPSLGALPEALATNGSFCAIRVLQQDTKAFDDTVKSEAARLNVPPDWLAAKLMGRWYKGAPLSLHPDTEPPGKSERNDFDYAPSYEYPDTPMDHIGERCPVGAHIRRGNPRTARVAGARYARRVMRRGMHYEITDAQGQREVGLFGMFICADLERQFEFIQRQWINGDRFAAGLRGTRDPIVGTPLGEEDVFSIPMPNASPLKVRLPQFVFTKGSLYMFMPGLDALRHLERFATQDPPAPAPRVLPSEPESLEDVMTAVLAELQGAAFSAFGALAASDLLEIAQASVGTFGKGQNRIGSQGNLRFDPRRRDFQINPYPVYASFRAKEPVHYSPLYDGWFVFGYDDVVRVCTENDNFSAAALGSTAPRGLFTLDVPQHTAVRQVVATAWGLAAAATSTFVQSSIGRTLAAIGAKSCFDLVDDFARPVPRDVYFDILGANGIDADDRLELDALARAVLKAHDHTFTDLQRFDGVLAGLKLAARLTKMLALATLALPGSRYDGSFLMHLGRAVVSGQLSLVVAVATLVILTCAGFMSVEFLLATGIRRLLLNNRAGWNEVTQDPSRVPLYLKEMRRAEPALSVIDRFAKRDIVIGGVPIPEGAPVFGVLASANRDHGVFGPDADTFNPYRTLPLPQPHLAFGWGAHECMGRSLEGSITGPAIRELAARMPRLRLQSAAQPPWFEDFYFRSFDHLAVTLN